MHFDKADGAMLETILNLFFVWTNEGYFQITGITEFTAFILILVLIFVIATLLNHIATLRSRHHQYEYTRSEFVNQEKCENEIDHLQDISERMMVILHVCRQLDGEFLPPIGKDADSSLTQCQSESSSEEVRRRLSLELDEAWKSLGAGAIFINYNDREGTGNHFCGVEHRPGSDSPSAFESLSLYDRASMFLTEAEHLLLDDKACTVQGLSSLYDTFLDCATCRLDHLDVGKNDARKQRRKWRHRNWGIRKYTVNRWVLDKNMLVCKRCKAADEDSKAQDNPDGGRNGESRHEETSCK